MEKVEYITAPSLKALKENVNQFLETNPDWHIHMQPLLFGDIFAQTLIFIPNIFTVTTDVAEDEWNKAMEEYLKRQLLVNNALNN